MKSRTITDRVDVRTYVLLINNLVLGVGAEQTLNETQQFSPFNCPLPSLFAVHTDRDSNYYGDNNQENHKYDQHHLSKDNV